MQFSNLFRAKSIIKPLVASSLNKGLLVPSELTQICVRFNSFKYKDLFVSPLEVNQMQKIPEPDQTLLFGGLFTDRMLVIDWTAESGWSRPCISPLQLFHMHPGAKVLHYASSIFEGLKAYRGIDDKIRLFRPDMNMRRFSNSAARAMLPAFDEGELLSSIIHLVSLESRWVPRVDPSATDSSIIPSLYVRPCLIGTEPTLGIAVSGTAKLYVLLSPVSRYFAQTNSSERSGVRLFASPDYCRAWPGGTGHHKLSANYAPTLHVQKQAEENGCEQVLWLYGDDRLITEVGTMNIFVLFRNGLLVTPPLGRDLVLPGVTRDSVLQLCREMPYLTVCEKFISIDELCQSIADNQVEEVFGSGTACSICSVRSIMYKDIEYTISTASSAALTRTLLRTLSDIQLGRIAHSWTTIVNG